MAKLDELIVENVKERLFTSNASPDTRIPDGASRGEKPRGTGSAAALKTELAATDERLRRLYRAIEDGIVDLDAHLKERIHTLKTGAGTRAGFP